MNNPTQAQPADAQQSATKRISRRALLTGGAGTVLVLVAGGLVWRAETQGVFAAGEGPAFAPWQNWRGEAQKGPLALVSAAILAANAHNTQPWIFEVNDTQINLLADQSRNLGVIDPFGRELSLGIGCALENLLLAAPAHGYQTQLTLLPDANHPNQMAQIDLTTGNQEPSPLYSAIPNRHTNRYAYDTTHPIEQTMLDSLTALNDDPAVAVRWFSTPAERQQLSSSLLDAVQALNNDQEQAVENSVKWLRLTPQAIQRERDGLTLDTMGLSTFNRIAGKMLPPASLSSANDIWLESIKQQTSTAAAFGILTLGDYDDSAQRLAAGRLWQRIHLWLTNEGWAAQPMNQLHERRDREIQLGIAPEFGNALRSLVNDPAQHGIFTFRLGFPTQDAAASPRRPVRDVVV